MADAATSAPRRTTVVALELALRKTGFRFPSLLKGFRSGYLPLATTRSGASVRRSLVS
jgi:hypothetical protein